MLCRSLLLQMAASNPKFRYVDFFSSLTHLHHAGFLPSPFVSTLKASQHIIVPSHLPLSPFLLQAGCLPATHSPKLAFSQPLTYQARCFASPYARQMDVCHPLTTLTWLPPSPYYPKLAVSQPVARPSCSLPAPLRPHARSFPASYSIKVEASQPLTRNAISPSSLLPNAGSHTARHSATLVPHSL